MKKKILALLINIFIMFTFVTSITTNSIADVGDFESYDYDSGSDWDYDSGSSSWDWGYDYDYDSDGYGERRL